MLFAVEAIEPALLPILPLVESGVSPRFKDDFLPPGTGVKFFTAPLVVTFAPAFFEPVLELFEPRLTALAIGGSSCSFFNL